MKEREKQIENSVLRKSLDVIILTVFLSIKVSAIHVYIVMVTY